MEKQLSNLKVANAALTKRLKELEAKMVVLTGDNEDKDGLEALHGASVDRGEGTIDLIDLSTSLCITKAKLATIVHDRPKEIISDFILKDCKTGTFRRASLEETEGRHILFWQHFLNNKIVECEYP